MLITATISGSQQDHRILHNSSRIKSNSVLDFMGPVP